jgi:hypothetical protein
MIQFKRGTSKDWEKNEDLILEAGQPGYNITANKLKIGNGKDKWKDLKYLSGGFSFLNYGSTGSSDSEENFYIKEYDGDVESDYVIEGPTRNKNYCYRKWASGFIECWGEGTKIPDLKSLVVETIFELQSGNYFEVKGFWKRS